MESTASSPGAPNAPVELPNSDGDDAAPNVVDGAPKMLPVGWVWPNAALLAPKKLVAGADAAPKPAVGAAAPKPKVLVLAAPKAGADAGEPNVGADAAPKAGAGAPKVPEAGEEEIAPHA